MGAKSNKPSPDDVLKYINELNPEALYPTDMKDAVIGYQNFNGRHKR